MKYQLITWATVLVHLPRVLFVPFLLTCALISCIVGFVCIFSNVTYKGTKSFK